MKLKLVTKKALLLVVVILALVGVFSPVFAASWKLSGVCKDSKGNSLCVSNSNCSGSPPSGQYCCCDWGKNDGNGDDGSNGGDEGVGVDVGGDWAKEVFGDTITLNIMKPINFWDMEGVASIGSIIGFLFSLVTLILFVGFLFAIGIGIIKWISSQGNEAKIQSAQKWLKNAVMGFVAVIGVFLIANFITVAVGIGSVLDMGQNLASCNDVLLYKYKEDNPNQPEGCVWKCNGGWRCVVPEESKAGDHPGI